MEYLNLSKEKTSNFMLSRIGLGSMRMGDVSEGINTIHTALDGGVNFLNTADFYGNGQSEMLIKEALKTRKREDVFISVKFGAMQGVDGRMYGMDARPEAVENYLRYTLSRLGTDYVDLYQPARINPHIPVEDTIGAISDLAYKRICEKYRNLRSEWRDTSQSKCSTPDQSGRSKIFVGRPAYRR